MIKEILKVSQNEFTVNVTAGQIDSLREKKIEKKGVRVFNDGKVFSSSFVGAMSDEQLIDRALSNSDGAMVYDWQTPSVDAGSKQVVADSMEPTDFIGQLKQGLEFFSKKYPQFLITGNAHLNKSKTELKVADNQASNSIDISDFAFYYKHKKSKGLIDGIMAGVKVAGIEVQPVIEQYTPFLEAFDVNAKMQNGKMPVVFAFGSQMFKKILESARVDNYKKGVGLYSDRLGEKIFNEKFSLHDVSYDPELHAFTHFDGEGHVRKDPVLPIIKEGVFKNVIADLRNAKKYGMDSTGNGQRSYNSAVALGYNSVRTAPGQRTTDQILADLPECLVVELAAGGEFTDTGDYSTPVQGAYLMSQGRVLGRAPQLTVKSSVDQMFGDDLVEIASNPLSQADPCPAVFTQMQVIIN